MKINRKELCQQGWTIVHGISSGAELMLLGQRFGTPTLTPNGEYLKEIGKCDAHLAPPQSQSALYGRGPFPLHTDTVFWETPIRYVLLRGYGDTRRPTTVQNIETLLRQAGKTFFSYFSRSLWTIQAGNRNFYSCTRFRDNSEEGIRVDVDLMHPGNQSSKAISAELRCLVSEGVVESINWDGNSAVIIDNWKAMHGRGKEPFNEGDRVIERLYVR